MPDKTQEPHVRPDPEEQDRLTLLNFRIWASNAGHYSAVGALDRYERFLWGNDEIKVD